MLDKGKDFVTEFQLNTLETELNAVLERLSKLLTEPDKSDKTEIADEETISEIINKLEPLLTGRKPECMYMLDDIRKIPGSEELANHVENFEFEKALASLEALKV